MSATQNPRERRSPYPRSIRIAVLFGLCLFSAACATTEAVKDIRQLRQDNLFYLDPATAGRPAVGKEDQRVLNAQYDSLFFSPWRQDRTRHSSEEITVDFQHYAKKPGYGENMRKHPPSWIREIAANAHMTAYPNASRKGITVANADLRVLPTHKPHFDSPNPPAGWPFDNMQNSAVAANTPLFVSHVSRDRAWLFVETGYAFGWLPARDVAFPDEAFRKAWENGRYAVIVRDKTPVHDDRGRFLFHAPLGAIFPMTDGGGGDLEILVALADPGSQAVLRTARMPREAARPKPLEFTQENVALLANELINEPYGWGGLYRNRDCSAMLMDLFAPFGIWLPRHSAKQAREGGRFVDLQNLSPEAKERKIIAEGVPFLTLLWRRGHIMLYIGARDGKALVFHNLWGLRTRNLLGREGRKVVGHAAITTLRPGIELWNFDIERGDLLSNLLGMTILGAAPPSR